MEAQTADRRQGRWGNSLAAVKGFGLLGLIGGVIWEAESGGYGAAVGPKALLVCSYFAIAIGCLIDSRIRNRASDAVHAVLFAAVAASYGVSKNGHVPAFLHAAGLVALIATFLVVIPYAAFCVIKEQDERERKIVRDAMSISCALTVLMLAACVLLRDYFPAADLDIKWPLLVAGGSWLGSWYVLKERR